MPSTPPSNEQTIGEAERATRLANQITSVLEVPLKAGEKFNGHREQNKENIKDDQYEPDDREVEHLHHHHVSPDIASVEGGPEPVTQSPVTKANSSTTHQTGTGPAYAADGGYDALKSFNGQVYSGMAVGGSHVWNYEPGVWTETKVEPDLWQIDFETIKKRNKNAPTGSGAPVGTEYHWIIVAHQYVKKLDANSYSTHLVGSKYKLAHKNAASDRWSVATVKGQRVRELELLDDAKRRVEGLPPVLATEKVKSDKQEKGQQKLDSLFSKATGPTDVSSNAVEANKKRKRNN